MTSKKTNLVLLTSNYPFGSGESFLDYELDYLDAYFRKIVIISSNIKDAPRKELGDRFTIYRYNTEATLADWLSLPIILIRQFKVLQALLKDELNFRKSVSQSLSNKQKRWILKRALKAIDLQTFVKGILAKEQLKSNTMLYSYWLNTGAHAISLIDGQGIKKIARGHGSDVYEYVMPAGIHPMHHHLSNHLDGIFFISEFGKGYFEKRFPSKGQNTFLSRLGISIGENESKSFKDELEFTIVSCSNVNRLKRLNLIIDGLKDLESDQTIRWIHFGDGPLMKDIKAYAEKNLKDIPNIFYSFEGQVTNQEVHAFYLGNRVDLILNVSETEGIPVSIMEAQAYGIPAIATDVGGSSEIVNQETGILLEKEFQNEQLVSALNSFLLMKEKEKNEFKDRCKTHWNEKFNARTNFTQFIKDVDGIITS